ncbi:TetR family transcriptional regulator [Rubrobacter marinus]|uniref:TetR family transcriptional regulator n=1 Tax=Rubrobacter marinus TaxID=2653852 RepID=A0A6G8Q144_9ACTN|nr:TetR/AcrR family transcriptional regulator [Rubrobacter marinus]QIN80130.1 TetR family transcriptional regulator [Rubrobacter marinus]
MGIKERGQRQRQTLRSGILAAAREIASTEGWRAVTIRKIAAYVEYSPPVIYEYFDSKEDLLLELVREGYAGQLEAIEKARNSSNDPEEALLAMARTWCRFAFESPDLYQVMYGLGGVSFPVMELQKEGEKIAGTMAEVLEEILVENGKETKDVWTKVTLAWGAFHGLVALAMAGRLQGGNEEAEKLTDQAARDLVNAWLAA